MCRWPGKARDRHQRWRISCDGLVHQTRRRDRNEHLRDENAVDHMDSIDLLSTNIDPADQEEDPKSVLRSASVIILITLIYAPCKPKNCDEGSIKSDQEP
jgi:hypothetical protein